MKFFRCVLFLGLWLMCGPLLHTQNISSTYIIQLSDDSSPDQIREYFDSHGVSIQMREIAPSINAWHLDPRIQSRRKSTDWNQLLANCPGIVAFQVNRTYQPRRVIPNDPQYPEQWYLDLIRMPDAWELTTGEVFGEFPQPVVGVLEAGFDFSRPDLEGILFENPGEIPENGIDDDGNGFIDDVNGWNLDSEDGHHYIDYTYHGDAVVSIIAARGNNNTGIAGINWHGSILPITLEARNTDETTIRAYEYFYQMRKRYNETNGTQGAFIVATNSSFGLDGLYEEDAPLFCAMYDKMGSVGILSVGATSNQDVNVDIHGDLPSDCSSDALIITNSIDRNLMNQYSGRGTTSVDLAAPAQNVLVVSQPGEFIDDSGTSFAAPQVSAVISLAYSLGLDSMQRAITADPVQVAAQVRSCILQTVTPATDLADENATGGYLNAHATLQCIYNRYFIPESDEPIALHELYPNATSEILNIQYLVKDTREKVHVVVYDILGRKVYQSELDPATENPGLINVRKLPAGVYALTLIQDGHATTKQFVKY